MTIVNVAFGKVPKLGWINIREWRSASMQSDFTHDQDPANSANLVHRKIGDLIARELCDLPKGPLTLPDFRGGKGSSSKRYSKFATPNLSSVLHRS
ncbi:hypothetical protein [Thalassospira xianhensis]|uniref:hypothetical protein n=1 Tax=Thalassospira xianhensis TaxID=478503 RepID=UPI00142E378B|nr:hypothetical protein [Thalassospira xianhensis]